MLSTLRVLALLELLGLAALPLTARALVRLPAGGLVFAKPLGLLLAAWVAWLAASLGVPNGTWSALAAVAVLLLAGALVWWRSEAALFEDPAAQRHLVAGEVVFVLGFLAAALFVAYTPAVWETEKPMDMAFLNATIVSESYPPHDPWMAGEELNYYYLGHVAAGMLVRLTGVEPTVGYNLAFAAIIAMALAGAFALGAALAEAARRHGLLVRRPLVAGAGAAVALLLMGSLRGGGKALSWDGSLRNFDWFGQSRVIEDTINEFPYFSLLVQDLHGHVIALPFTLLALAFTMQVALDGPPRARLRGALETLLAALSIGALYAINSWSWPVAVGLLALATAVWSRDGAAAGRRAAAAGWCVLVIALGIVLLLPFIVAFDPNAKGFGIVDEREPFGLFMRHNLVIYGGLAWLVGALYASRLQRAAHPWRILVWGAALAAVVLSLLAPADLAGAAVVAALAGVALHATFSTALAVPERVLWLLIAAGFTCIAGPELLYVRDEFDGGEFYRMNTVFKLGYQAWILLAIPAGCALAMSAAWLGRAPRIVWGIGAAAVIAVGLSYTVAGAYARKDGFSASPQLDGRAWLARLAPGDVEAIDWIRDNVPRDAVVLEGVGDDYSAFGHARISTYTGRQTVLGWQGHELQWSHDPGSRRDDVRLIYTASDPSIARSLLARYRVSYAVLGPIERTDYGTATVLQSLGRKVFDKDGTTVYELPRPAARRSAPSPTPSPVNPVLGG